MAAEVIDLRLLQRLQVLCGHQLGQRSFLQRFNFHPHTKTKAPKRFRGRLVESIPDYAFAVLVFNAFWATFTNSPKPALSVAAMSAIILRSKPTFAAFNPSINRL